MRNPKLYEKGKDDWKSYDFVCLQRKQILEKMFLKW